MIATRMRQGCDTDATGMRHGCDRDATGQNVRPVASVSHPCRIRVAFGPPLGGSLGVYSGRCCVRGASAHNSQHLPVNRRVGAAVSCTQFGAPREGQLAAQQGQWVTALPGKLHKALCEVPIDSFGLICLVFFVQTNDVFGWYSIPPTARL